MKDVIVFDLDGTLALVDHRTHHIRGKEKDWKAFYEACDQDEPYEAVLAVARALVLNGYKLWIVSGREDSVRRKTADWLQRHHIAYDQLLMRPTGDYTADHDLKKRWLESTLPRDRILCVYEDRDNVVKMWRDAGIPCFQVAPGNF